MEWLNTALNYLSNGFQTVIDFIAAIPYMFENLLSYIQLYMLKAKITGYIWWLEISYRSAQILLEEIGFNELLVTVFNGLSPEIRYYAYLFGIPQAITIFTNFFTTAFVMRMTR
ncbi:MULTISPECIES: DUF2523 family protein [Vibrio]|uniref:DUF2523 domain-containing protein n=1 Tax=Vibrio genomosp. F6 str. FF-238 TaxID=1191298 RepID=A0A1E5CL79_9VIBR|nr:MULTISPECIES: DUF2523 family protein [Vibrio]MDN3699343.1 DUF2523 family protein [Vibrio cortegadensis]OEE69456.1 DUF2523 domain-containing protein [Vibrio genomosp. F6 str. FF-238]